jgi:hypothetical protein
MQPAANKFRAAWDRIEGTVSIYKWDANMMLMPI